MTRAGRACNPLCGAAEIIQVVVQLSRVSGFPNIQAHVVFFCLIILLQGRASTPMPWHVLSGPCDGRLPRVVGPEFQTKCYSTLAYNVLEP